MNELIGSPPNCTCKLPWAASSDGRCTLADAPTLASACRGEALQHVCKNLPRRSAHLPVDFSKLVLPSDAIDTLLYAVSRQTAYVFRTGTPKPDEDRFDRIDPAHQALADDHWPKLAQARQFLIMGRASQVGDRERNEDLARRRMRMVLGALLRACEGATAKPSECADFFERGHLVAMPHQYALSAQDFSHIFGSRKSTQVAEEGHVEGETKKKWRASGQAEERQVERAMAGRRDSRGEEYISQAVFVIPLPCECTDLTGSAAPQ